jgi:hypothetical protein
MWLVPGDFTLVEGWSRYEWFRLLTQTVLGFATIPAFLIPLTLAGETVDLERAGVSYAVLMALSNTTDMLEGAIGAGLYKVLTLTAMDGLLAAFHGSWFDIAGIRDERTLILQMFVYISLIFTVLTLPFIALLRREFARRGLSIDLRGRGVRPEHRQYASHGRDVQGAPDSGLALRELPWRRGAGRKRNRI